MSDYTVRIKHEPSAPDDPIPWSYSVSAGGTVLYGGWAGTEAEAHEYADDWIERDLADEAQS